VENPSRLSAEAKLMDDPAARANRIELCGVADIASGSALKVEAQGQVFAVFNVGGQYYVTDDACTHGPGSLSEGYLEGDVVECNFHGGRFNVRTGGVIGPPCMVPVKTYLAIIEEGRVFIETSD
jgi:nitrite reductase/ring-hydroxylating ferredoxin subunit